MDTLRGNFADRADPVATEDDFDPVDDYTGRDAPPPEIGQDERRMQVRAYNHWASLLHDRNFPSIDDLDTENLPDFGPCSVLLDFTEGIEDPGISFIGDKLARECGATEDIHTLSDVPSRSLLSRITDHYMQILANQAPIGFEAEFVDERGATILYRGILLPFSSDDDTIDFIYGVINWKELADQRTTDELMLEIDQALDEEPAPVAQRHDDLPLADWADGPAAEVTEQAAEPERVLDLGAAGTQWTAGDAPLPAPSFGDGAPEHHDEDEDDEMDGETAAWFQPGWAEPAEETDDDVESIDPDTATEKSAGPRYASLASLGLNIGGNTREPVDLELDHGFEPSAHEPSANLELEEDYEFDATPVDAADMGLGDWLASARELALAARSSEDRTRSALYEAIGRAYDFSLAAAEAPEEFDELIADAGLTAQDRAPMTPVVKLVFGADYDKTRLTEYATALSHAYRNRLARGSLANYLRDAEGGLKGVVAAERRARREEAGKPVEQAGAPREELAARLRALEPQAFEEIAPDGREFALVMIRRTDAGDVVMLGEVPDDVALVERAARKLLG